MNKLLGSYNYYLLHVLADNEWLINILHTYNEKNCTRCHLSHFLLDDVRLIFQISTKQISKSKNHLNSSQESEYYLGNFHAISI